MRMMPIRGPLRVIAVFAALVLAGCSGGGSSSEPSEAAAPFTGEVATVDGGALAGSSLAGEDVVLWFWAPW